ncbi:MAG: acyl-CoA reductase [Steroidobacteraceae bacterium]
MSRAGYSIPLVIRGRVIEDTELTFSGRGNNVSFTTPDVKRHLNELVLALPSQLGDLYSLSFEQILDYLAALGERLSFAKNRHVQEAFELSVSTSGLSEGTLRHMYEDVGEVFRREVVREMTDRVVGIRYLEDWVETPLENGCVMAVRAFGARTVHVVAGNAPLISALSIVRNAVLRSDAIIKTPSNDPLTATAIARTMVELDANHPLTRHLSVVYWKGGDTAVERNLFAPEYIEKIIAWGGMASVNHITQYIQPGIDLITLDPKLSSSIIGAEAFASEATTQEAADRLALDVGAFNQEGCVNARVVYVQSGTHHAGIARLNRFGAQVYDAIQALPAHLSGPARSPDPHLMDEIDSLRYSDEWHRVIGGGPAGAVIVSQFDEPVEFSRLLAHRVVNLVPIDALETAILAVNSYTQTIGIYPESLKKTMRDRLPLHGAQRIVSLGYATRPMFAGPHDAIEPMRRMCKWIIDEQHDPAVVPLASRLKRT